MKDKSNEWTPNNADLEAPAAVSESVSFLCGLLSGIFQAGLFNPIDRALYLSVKEHRPFLSRLNFEAPYRGFFQSLGGRALSGGLFYPLEHFFLSYSPPDAGPWANFLAGTGAGMINALLLNPLTAVKYKTWGSKKPQSMMVVAQNMYRKGGMRPFFNGFQPTLYRDVIFGGSYTYLRLEIKYWFQLSDEQQWIGNLVAAAFATVLSGPLNLARNVQYSTKSRVIRPSVGEVLRDFLTQINEQSTLTKKAKHAQNRLRIGWGTARVAVGMTFGHYIYEELIWFALNSKERVLSRELNEAEKEEIDSSKYPNRRPSLLKYHQTYRKKTHKHEYK
mmetsp:Transcript_28904/g.43649  ORF Transcript_28904/g.43649 Transcript_28904/m.43649 type:complete len:333 (+) Transcript_28904:424-1422(+)|eukprot:CAMPEP_0178902494 /NCGR_PEP_ID=MMETSP0786-20121207/4634_1 /TAXON_ID=186022 /ORGANISM="Thalassionema frauenfeldii, Strain CCMP 1798" /LENGTH=332 /DNA_ID=CAMNT_0020573763 /DNA_START=311 /DNA_END=1309 /DNA_ORIENTATION=+